MYNQLPPYYSSITMDKVKYAVIKSGFFYPMVH